MMDGELLSSNCDKPGYNRPALLVLDEGNVHIELMSRGQRVPDGVRSAIACGPNLVTDSQFAIPEDDLNVNIWERTTNVAVGLVQDGDTPSTPASRVHFVVSDGHDNCPHDNLTCGISSAPLAYFMLDAINCTAAMEMDQGGSATLWLAGFGVVSNPGMGLRHVYDGLFMVPYA